MNCRLRRRNRFPHCRDWVAQAGAVTLGLSRKRRAEWFRLAKGQIAAEDSIAVRAESFGEGNEQGSVAVAAGTVSKDEGMAVWGLRRVEETADGGIERVVEK